MTIAKQRAVMNQPFLQLSSVMTMIGRLHYGDNMTTICKQWAISMLTTLLLGAWNLVLHGITSIWVTTCHHHHSNLHLTDVLLQTTRNVKTISSFMSSVLLRSQKFCSSLHLYQIEHTKECLSRVYIKICVDKNAQPRFKKTQIKKYQNIRDSHYSYLFIMKILFFFNRSTSSAMASFKSIGLKSFNG